LTIVAADKTPLIDSPLHLSRFSIDCNKKVANFPEKASFQSGITTTHWKPILYNSDPPSLLEILTKNLSKYHFIV